MGFFHSFARFLPRVLASPSIAVKRAVKKNEPLLEKSLAAGGNTRAAIVVVPGGSHSFVEKTQFCPQQFEGVPPQAPELFEALASWNPFSY